MIIVMKPQATQDHVDHVCTLIREMGLKDHVIHGSDLDVVAVIGDETKADLMVLENAEGVNKVMRVMEPYKLASIDATEGKRTQVRLGEDVVIGGPQVPVIAGPCSVESEEKILEAARAAKAAGAHALRGGAFKPRTNPYAFQGHGEDGLKMLAAARAETGLPIVTEVLTPTDVAMVAKYADCLQIGTRNSQNYKLLEACGDTDKPIMLKRGMAMAMDEFLQAAEYILAAGNPNVLLCERGIRTFENHTRNTLSLSAVPELHQRTHLPVVIDPSHGTGHARLVPDMARAAVAAGADCIILEMHPDPERAMTDGAQSITPETLTGLMPSLARVAEAIDRSCAVAVGV